MKPGKMIDKTKGPVKTSGPAGPSAPSKKSASTKQQKMGHAKKAQKAPDVLCAKGHPTKIVHYNRLRNMRRWCPACQELSGSIT